MEKNLPEHEDILVGHEHLEGVDTNLENIDKKSSIRETLNLSTCADINIVSKTEQNIWVQFGTPPRF